MAEKQHPEFRLDSFDFINFLFRNFRLFVIVGVLAFIVSVAVSFTISPMYKSNVVLYPASNITMPGSALFDIGSNVLTFGDEEATEKILQMLQSQSIRDYLVQKYDLFSHYEIPEDAKFRHTLMGNKLDKNIAFRKTRFLSVEISVLDTDPEIAANIANEIALLTDKSFNNILKEAGRKQQAVLQSQMQQQTLLVRTFEDSIKQAGGSKVVGYRSATGGQGVSVSPYSPEMMRFTAGHEQALEDLGTIRQRLTEARMASNEDQSYTLIVNEARPSEKKDFPNRSVIAIVSTLSSLLLLMLLLIFLEGLKPAPLRT